MPLAWIFDPAPASGARHGGLAQAEVFDKDIDTFVREVLQNARDQRRADSERVRVRFRLEEISGPELEAFLASIRWDQLEPHLEAIAEASYVTISPRVRDGLDRIRGDGRLRLLRIDDYGTNGLTGEEDEYDSNFNALCRHTLITAAGRRVSGGSFGLGKSVLWRFSDLSTVLFASGVSGSVRRPRFFGRTLLAWHEARGGEWEGSGWLGEPEHRPMGQRAVSIWDEVALDASQAALLKRPEFETGTSILIVGFDDPAVEDERSIEELGDDFVASAARWFWPALVKGEMEIVIEAVRDGADVFHRQVHSTGEVQPFLLASSAEGPLVERLGEPGDISEHRLQLRVPAQRLGSVADPRPAATADAVLRVRLAETGEDLLLNTIALQRGTGMVIQYYNPPRRVLGDQTFHGTLVVGTALADGTGNQSAEEFLRAAEPVAHSEWVATTDRIRAEYKGGAAALRELFDAIADAVRRSLREEPIGEQEGPEALRRFFPLPGIGGGSVAREPYRLSAVTGYITDRSWVFGGAYSSASMQHSAWRFRVALLVEQEGGGAGDALLISTLTVSAGSANAVPDSAWWEVIVPAGVQRVRFDGRAAANGVLPENGIRRALVRLVVRTVSGPST